MSNWEKDELDNIKGHTTWVYNSLNRELVVFYSEVQDQSKDDELQTESYYADYFPCEPFDSDDLYDSFDEFYNGVVFDTPRYKYDYDDDDDSRDSYIYSEFEDGLGYARQRCMIYIGRDTECYLRGEPHVDSPWGYLKVEKPCELIKETIQEGPNQRREVFRYPETACYEYLERQLKSVIFLDGVKSLDDFHFKKYMALESVSIQCQLPTIRVKQFYQSLSLITVNIPPTVTSIGRKAFSFCTQLRSITIPDSITAIEKGTFFRCGNLISVNIPQSVVSIGKKAFYGCYLLNSVTIPESVTVVDEKAFCCCEMLIYISFPSSVKSIGKRAFYECKNLKYVIIPDSLTEIGKRAFCNCKALTSIDIPDSVTLIGKRAFEGCGNLHSIRLLTNMTSLVEEVFRGFVGLTSFETPNSITSIGKGAFSGCTMLSSIVIPKSVTSIEVLHFLVRV